MNERWLLPRSIGSRSLPPRMYPVLFEIPTPWGGLVISTFGVMMAIAFLVGSWITAIRMKENLDSSR